MTDEKLYEKALKLYDSPLWDEMSFHDIFAVEFSDGTTGYVHMEGMGSYMSVPEDISFSGKTLQVFTGEEGVRYLNLMYPWIGEDEWDEDDDDDWDEDDEWDDENDDWDEDDDDESYPFDEEVFDEEFEAWYGMEDIISRTDIFTSQHYIEIRYLPCYEEGTEDDECMTLALEAAGSLGIDGIREFPEFSVMRCCNPMTYDLTEAELRYMSEVLDAALFLSEAVENEKISMDIFDGEEFSPRVPFIRADRSVGRTLIPSVPELSYHGLIRSPKKAQSIRKLRKDDEWECTVIRIPFPDSDDDGHMFFPTAVASWSVKHRQPVNFALMEYVPGSMTEMYTDELLDEMRNSPGAPSMIRARDERTMELLKETCESCGIILSLDEDTHELNVFLADFMRDRFGYLLDDGWDRYEDDDEDDEEDWDEVDWDEDDWDEDDWDEDDWDEDEWEDQSGVRDRLLEGIIRMLNGFSDEEIRGLDPEMKRTINDLVTCGELPEELSERLRRIFRSKK